MRRIYVPLFALLAGAGVCCTPPLHPALAHGPERGSHQDFPPRTGGTPIVIGIPNLNPPTATTVSTTPHSQKPASPADPIRLALSDSRVKALLKGKAYRVERVAPWLAGKGKLVKASFYHPVTVSGTWLAVGKSPYRATYDKVVGISIYVEVVHRSVAAIKPRFHSG
jgi:hypothetical protein